MIFEKQIRRGSIGLKPVRPKSHESHLRPREFAQKRSASQESHRRVSSPGVAFGDSLIDPSHPPKGCPWNKAPVTQPGKGRPNRIQTNRTAPNLTNLTATGFRLGRHGPQDPRLKTQDAPISDSQYPMKSHQSHNPRRRPPPTVARRRPAQQKRGSPKRPPLH